MQDVSRADNNSHLATPQSGLFWVVLYLFCIFAHMHPSVRKTLILSISFCQPFSLDTGLAIPSVSIQMAHSRQVFLSICSYLASCVPQWGVVQICRLARFSTDADVDWKLSQKWLICLWHLHKIALNGIYWIYIYSSTPPERSYMIIYWLSLQWQVKSYTNVLLYVKTRHGLKTPRDSTRIFPTIKKKQNQNTRAKSS